MHAHMAVPNGKWTDPHTKANALLQSHFSGSHLSAAMQADQRTVLPLVMRLLQVRTTSAAFFRDYPRMFWVLKPTEKVQSSALHPLLGLIISYCMRMPALHGNEALQPCRLGTNLAKRPS